MSNEIVWKKRKCTKTLESNTFGDDLKFLIVNYHGKYSELFLQFKEHSPRSFLQGYSSKRNHAERNAKHGATKWLKRFRSM